jgi:hypothetical protein
MSEPETTDGEPVRREIRRKSMRRIVIEALIKRDGIQCSWCQTDMTIENELVHIGFEPRR